MGMGLVRFGALAHTSPDAISAYLRDAEAPAVVRAIRDSDDTAKRSSDGCRPS
jgi:hypothetical protein